MPGPQTDAAPSPPTVDASVPPPPPPPPSASRWMPKPGTSWQWQLSGTGNLDTSLNVAAYDIDLFETSQATIDTLHAAGRKVICYFDTAYEPGRPDSATLAPYRHNAVKGWPGQYWLDVREPVVVNVMKSRIAMAAQRHCDAVEADDVDSRDNNPGTGITAGEQQAFIRTLAAEAHAQGMSFALKNDLADIPALLNDVDFAINEECFAYNECDALVPFIQAGKAVLQVEYTSGALSSKSGLCARANAMNFDTLIKHLNLDAARYACR
ncbi:MAG: endo alpha-1,4 polygalactosaminidase [Myxococcales bacterium]|nr:endo alpha-1,4 polygalactosaminidase [Myxococcales bacterium]